MTLSASTCSVPTSLEPIPFCLEIPALEIPAVEEQPSNQVHERFAVRSRTLHLRPRLDEMAWALSDGFMDAASFELVFTTVERFKAFRGGSISRKQAFRGIASVSLISGLEGAAYRSAQAVIEEGFLKVGLKRLADQWAPAYLAFLGIETAKDVVELARFKLSPVSFGVRLFRNFSKSLFGLGGAKLGGLCGMLFGPVGITVGTVLGCVGGDVLIAALWPFRE